ncbi:hypothetical protein FS837_004540, partial [Tulasnella sp. UAMH 9824]
YQNAEQAFREAHKMHSRIGHNLGAANALTGLGEVYRARSEYQKAEQTFEEAHRIYSRIGNDQDAVRALHCLGNLCFAQFRYQDMETFYCKAVSAELHDDTGSIRAGLLYFLGLAQLAQRKYSEAEDAATEALALSISMENKEVQATASFQVWLCQPNQAELADEFIQTLAFRERTGHDSYCVMTLESDGDTHFDQGMYTEAEECYRLAQAIYSSIDDVHGEARELLRLGWLYTGWDRHGDAEECFTQARAVYASLSDEVGEAKALDGLMTVYGLQGKIEDVVMACIDACRIYTRTGRAMREVCSKAWEFVQYFVE